MEAFKTIIWIINIFSALAVIVLVLMQQGKGADAGAAFGSGSAQGVFGAAGNANFLSRSTAMAAMVNTVAAMPSMRPALVADERDSPAACRTRSPGRYLRTSWVCDCNASGRPCTIW